MLKRSTLLWLTMVGCAGDAALDLPPVLITPQLDLTVTEDGTTTIDATAADPEGLTLTYSISTPAHGTISGTGPVYTYKPAANYAGADAVIVTISDGHNFVEVPVRILVSQIDDAPVAQDVSATTNENQGVSVTLVATDLDSPALRYTVVTPPAHGTLSGTPPN